MKRINIIIVACALSFFSFVASAEPITLQFSHNASPESPKASVATRFQQLVKEKIGDDKVVVNIASDAELFDDNKILDETLNGETDLSAVPLSALKKYSPRFQVFDLPFVFSSSTAAQKFVKGEIGMRLLNTLKPNGLHGFGYLAKGMRQLSSNKLMVTPQDLEGLKIQIADSIIEKQWLESTGAVPVKKALPEVYESLKSGELDGQVNGWSSIYENKLFEEQSFIVESDHNFIAYVVMASEQFWQKVPADLRPQLSAIMEEAIVYGNAVSNEKASVERQAIIEAGKAKVYKLTVDQRQAWTEAMLPVWKQFEGEIGEGLIQAAASQR